MSCFHQNIHLIWYFIICVLQTSVIAYQLFVLVIIIDHKSKSVRKLLKSKAPVLIKILCSDIIGPIHTEKEAERCVEGRTQFALAFPTVQIFVIISGSLMILPCLWFHLWFIQPTSYKKVQKILQFHTVRVYGKSQKSIRDEKPRFRS